MDSTTSSRHAALATAGLPGLRPTLCPGRSRPPRTQAHAALATSGTLGGVYTVGGGLSWASLSPVVQHSAACDSLRSDLSSPSLKSINNKKTCSRWTVTTDSSPVQPPPSSVAGGWPLSLPGAVRRRSVSLSILVLNSEEGRGCFQGSEPNLWLQCHSHRPHGSPASASPVGTLLGVCVISRGGDAPTSTDKPGNQHVWHPEVGGGWGPPTWGER